MSNSPLREAPASSPLYHGTCDPAFPNVGGCPESNPRFEEELNVDNIQGNIIGGFNKDFQMLLCLEIKDPKKFKTWLKSHIPCISTAAEVVAFNRLFRRLRTECGDPPGIKATWVNIAFTAKGLSILGKKVSKFADTPFKEGLAARAVKHLSDPKDETNEGNPKKWKVGGPNNPPTHVLVIVASDDREDMLKKIEDMKLNDNVKESTGAEISFDEEGINPPRETGLTGHEHFGTLDGVSQPGIRGRVSDDPFNVLTPRQNPENRNQGKPGQELIWPGEFVFGYPGQDPKADRLEDSKGDVAEASTTDEDLAEWARDGSFLVFRRLRQDVFAFHKFQNKTGKDLKADPKQISAKLVGRWLSGAPTLRTPNADNRDMADDDCANNDFEFNRGEDSKPDQFESDIDCEDNFSEEDGFPKDDATDFETTGSEFATGDRVPFDAHTRKAYPRNELTPAGGDPEDPKRPADPDKSEVDTQTHRLLRRGIPFGVTSKSTPDVPVKDDPPKGRGLHFLAYQTSIERQFEFVIEKWVNNPKFSEQAAQQGHKCPVGGQDVLATGHDPVIGQSNGGADGKDRTRNFFIRLGEGRKSVCHALTTKVDWVIPTGGGYFFSPSIKALEELAGVKPKS